MLNKSNRKTINVDSSNLVPIYTFKQEDDGVLLLSLFKNSIPLDLTGQAVKLGVKRPNGTIVSIETLEGDDPFTIDVNNLDIKFKNSVFAIPGVCECDLELVDVNGKMTTASFFITVNKKVVGDTNIKATNDIAILDKIKLEEEKREEAEVIRKDNEAVRSNAEGIRVSSEKSRIENENLRRSSEETRVSNENERITNEEARKIKENERLENEKTRVLSETTREENETDRVLNEKTRVSKENERIENETNRVKSESDRVTAENDRVSKENDREINEQKRVSAEEEREAAELDRQTAYKEIQDARTDYFGTEHNNLEERLNEDFDNVHQRVNDSLLLPYEGTNISANNSYYGLIKDLTIKGRTLKNLINGGFKNWGMSVSGDNTITKEDYKITINKPETTTQCTLVLSKAKVPLKPNTKYTVVATISNNTLDIAFNLVHSYQNIMLTKNACTVDVGFNGIYVGSFTTIDDLSLGERLEINVGANRTGTVTIENYMILEGDYTNVPLSDLPFIEGIKSVGENEVTEDGKYKVKLKSCGKNLFDSKILKVQDKNVPITIKEEENICIVNSTREAYGLYIPFYAEQGQTLKVRGTVNGLQNLRIFKYSDNFIGGGLYNHDYFGEEAIVSSYDYPITETGVYMLRPWVKSYSATFTDFIATLSDDVSFESYKEQFIEYQLDEPLRSLPNGVCDTLNIGTGMLIRNVGKIVLNGTETISKIDQNTLENTLFFRFKNTEVKNEATRISMISDKFPGLTPQLVWKGYDDEGVGGGTAVGDGISIRILKSRLETEDIPGFKKWLAENTPIVYYELATPIVEQLEEHHSFSYEGITHITSDNLLPPTVSCKIPSNIPAVVSSLRVENETLNNEVSTLTLENEELKETNDIQDEVIDISLLATDEMYNMLEPILGMTAEISTLEVGEVSKMVDLYVVMIQRGLKTIDQVPARYKEEVLAILKEIEK